MFFAHGAAGSGKSTVMQKVKDAIDASGKKVIVAFPTGIAETFIYGGQLFIVLSRSNQRCYSRDD